MIKKNIFDISKKKSYFLLVNIFNYFGKRYFTKILFNIILIFLINILERKKFFFEKDISFDYCNNYGLLVYDYHYKFNIPTKIINIGDYIQSLAALQFLPKNCAPILIDRDTMQYYHGPKLKLIINGWFRIKEGNRFASEQISPFYVSFHINKEKSVDIRMINHLKKYQPIGCRDYYTYTLLLKKGIKAYFSSCLTTTLDINYKNVISKREEIIFIDYIFGKYPKADKYIKNLKAYNFTNITYLSHNFFSNISHIERFEIAHNLLKKYAKAKLVVTSRIHAALPCLALETPAILINKKYDYKRFDGLYDLLNTIGINSTNKFEIKINVNKLGLIYNPKKYLNYSINLKKMLNTF